MSAPCVACLGFSCLLLSLSLSASPLYGRLREEQERTERSADESLRLLRTSGDGADAGYAHDAGMGTASARDSASISIGDRATRFQGGNGRSNALGDMDVSRLGIGAEQTGRTSSPHDGAGKIATTFGSATASAAASAGAAAALGSGDSFGELTSTEDGENFEDEFDPILASIRKPPPKTSTTVFSAAANKPTTQATSAAFQGGGAERSSLSTDRSASTTTTTDRESNGDAAAALVTERKGGASPAASATFATGFLSMFPGSVRARAEDVVSKSTSAFRSALDSSGLPSAAVGKGKRRESDPPYHGDAGALELEEGRGDGGGGMGRRTARGGGDEEDIPMVSVDELLSEEEV